MKILAKLKEYRERWRFQRLLKENEWQGLIPGDVVEYKGRKLMYRGINKHGGPGMAQMPEPMFGPARPNESNCVYYIRTPGGMFPETIFGESEPPVRAGNTGVSIGFLNATWSELRKVGHITPEQWRAMAAV